VRAGAGAELGSVFFVEGDVVDPVQAVLDPQWPRMRSASRAGAGLGAGEADDRMDDRGPPPPGAKVADLAGDLDDLGACGRPNPLTENAFRGSSS
jgi:hypothetical protein